MAKLLHIFYHKEGTFSLLCQQVQLITVSTDAKRISHFLAFLSPLPTEFLHIPFRLFHPYPTVH